MEGTFREETVYANHIAQEIERTRQHLINLEQALEGLKPLITFEDGEAKILSKVRGEHKAITALVDICMKERRPGTSYCLVHGKNQETFEQLKAACAQIPPRASA